MESIMNLVWTGDPIESMMRLFVVLAALEFISVLASYLGGNR